jgi:hypothetical protein
MERYPTIRAAGCAPRRQDLVLAFLCGLGPLSAYLDKSVAGLVESWWNSWACLCQKVKVIRAPLVGLGGYQCRREYNL